MKLDCAECHDLIESGDRMVQIRHGHGVSRNRDVADTFILGNGTVENYHRACYQEMLARSR